MPSDLGLVYLVMVLAAVVAGIFLLGVFIIARDLCEPTSHQRI